MILFKEDYADCGHELILKALADAARTADHATYGTDSLTEQASEYIKAFFELEADANVFFLPTSTVANLVCLSATLKRFDAVIAPTSAHINVHEAGGLESCGYKILDYDSPQGKLTSANISDALTKHPDIHTVRPKTVTVSQSNELGSVYSIDELTTLASRCKQSDLSFYVDGARLAMGLNSSVFGGSPSDFGSRGIDAFSVGGTKNGGVFGEALVVNDQELAADMARHIKQHGALMAKGAALGAQFSEFFFPRPGGSNLWMELGGIANEMATRLFEVFKEAGVALERPPANQLFPRLSTTVVERLRSGFDFFLWGEPDENGYVQCRFTCSWSTTDAHIAAFSETLASIC